MERAILFRGIIKYPDDIFKGFWYGNLIIYANGDTFIRQIETGQEFEVIPETVGEFTGLTDKNGVRIFEGDVVRHFDLEKTKDVIFQNGSFGYNTFGGYDFVSYSENKSNFMIIHGHSDNIEVIGNIHDKHVL